MNLSPGTRLGPYEITAPLGAGGMGEVYRARDTRLGREVAVKVLPRHLSSNPEVRARFEREAKTVSSLNHPHICTLFDVGREGETDYLVMELVEGETLAARLEKGPLPIGETLKLGSEIADALDRAHRAGVVHRDLKPANVMLTKSGAKLMDFGLARASGPAPAAGTSGATMASLAQSPTVAHPLTAEGTILGTFQYMAPEQLEGEEADERSDLWALGCVLYEMATGARAFAGKSQASLIVSIMGAEPPSLSRAAPLTPQALDRLVAACLVRDRADRIQSAHDVKLQLGWIAEPGSEPGPAAAPQVTPRRGRERVAWTLAAVATAAAVVLGLRALSPAPASAPTVQAFLIPPAEVLFSSSIDKPLPLAISPDGSTIAFCARHGEGPDLLWVRSLGADDSRPLAGTEDAEGPFFSPDGKSLGFFADRKLKRVDVGGGPVITLADNIDPRGGSWNRDGVILFSPGAEGPLSSVSADGGTVTQATELDATIPETTHRYPHFLPDGRHFLYLARTSGAGAGRKPTIYIGEFGTTARKPILDVASNVAYASGHLLYVRERVLVAQRFDPDALRVEGPAVPLVDDVRMDERFSRGVFAASDNGVLVCMTGNTITRTQLRWYDRAGRRLGEVGEPADYTYGGSPQISPDGRNAVISIANTDRGTSDVWLVELESGRRRKLTVDTLDHPHGIWLPGGKAVAVTTNNAGASGVDGVAIDGTRTWRIIDGPDFTWPLSAWGDVLLYAPETYVFLTDILAASLSGTGNLPPLAQSPADEVLPQFSPDGRFVAYASNETGRYEIFVAAYPQPGGRWQVSQSGGVEPRWNRDGRQVYYMDLDNYLVSVEVERPDSGFRVGSSQRLFQVHGAGSYWRYDVSPDGSRFLLTEALEANLASPVTLITGWTGRADVR